VLAVAVATYSPNETKRYGVVPVTACFAFRRGAVSPRKPSRSNRTSAERRQSPRYPTRKTRRLRCGTARGKRCVRTYWASSKRHAHEFRSVIPIQNESSLKPICCWLPASQRPVSFRPWRQASALLSTGFTSGGTHRRRRPSRNRIDIPHHAG